MKEANASSRGRPATGVTPMLGLRVSDALRAAVVKWAECQPDMPKLSEAIRRLVELGLASQSSARRPRVLSTSKQGAVRAAELAGKTIDKQLGPKVTAEERKVRKRKLVEGPSIFRDDRADSANKKS